MALLYGGTGGTFIGSVVSGEVYDPVYDTEMNASFIYNVLPSFYRTLMQDQEIFSTLWSGSMQETAAGLLNAWQVDYAKSLNTVPVLSQRKWQLFDLYRGVDFSADPGLTRRGIAGVFTYDTADEVLLGETANRARHDRNVLALRGVVDEDTSLAWDVELTVDESQPLAGAIFGYFASGQERLRSSLSVGVIGAEGSSNEPRPFILHTDENGLGTASVSAYTLEIGSPYKFAATYTAASKTLVLVVVDLRHAKLLGSEGRTYSDGGSPYTNVFHDLTVNFDTEGIVVGDVLVVLDNEYEILSVDGGSLLVKPIGLPTDVKGAAYTILGEVEVASVSLDIASEAPIPAFQADQFGVGNLDTGAINSLYVTSPAAAKRKSLSFTTSAWRYLDPTIAEALLALPRLQDTITGPTVLLHEGTDYRLLAAEGGTTLQFQEPPLRAYWAEYAAYDEGYIKNNFGANVGLEEVSSKQYKARVRGLYYAYFQGPTVSAIRTGVHILLGLPIAEEDGIVESINPAYSGTLGLLRVSGTDYLYPLAVGTSLSVGESVSQFEPLSEGVEVVDYLTKPLWWSGKLNFNEIQKFNTYQVELNLDVFSTSSLALASTFVQRVTPTWKDSFFLVYKNLADNVEISDRVVLAPSLHLYDTFCGPPSVVAYDETLYGGPGADWAYDQGDTEWDVVTPAMRQEGTWLPGYALLSNGDTEIAGDGTDFLAYLGGPGAIVDRRLALSRYLASVTGSTAAGSHVLTDASSDFLAVGLEVEVGDVVEVVGEGVFHVLMVTSTTLTLDAPLSTTAVDVNYEVHGALTVWCEVASVTDGATLDTSTPFPGVSGAYRLYLLNNLYFKAYYDRYDEVCPEESLSFVATISSGYTGAFPLAVTLPDSRTTTITQEITAPFGSPGDRVTSTLAELVP